jgi:hypothetical protein
VGAQVQKKCRKSSRVVATQLWVVRDVASRNPARRDPMKPPRCRRIQQDVGRSQSKFDPAYPDVRSLGSMAPWAASVVGVASKGEGSREDYLESAAR